jgi:serine/threonine protein kinase/tetratricopeptide (TPR) repeat protein
MSRKSPCGAAVPPDTRASFDVVSGDRIELRMAPLNAATAPSDPSGSTEVLVVPPDLVDRVAMHRAGASPGAPQLPAVGEAIGEFQLLAMLGRGIKGSVFLAIQPGLANRPLVLKITPRTGCEHLTMARLQHAHIVPLYWVQDLADRGLRVLCMPYLGGTTLAHVLDWLEEVPLELRTGRDVLEALDVLGAQTVVPMPLQGPARHFLARASYVQAICWVGACVADALHFAHQRNLLHLDLKPSNILLAADGTPMLLDFHLAQAPIRPDGPGLRRLGGTPAYMSPEQWAATERARGNCTVATEIDGRSDIYALGRLLYEAFCGVGALGAQPPIPRRFPSHPQVPAGLADMISRCLEYRPQDRYPDAALLAADLRRQLVDLPLKGVANRSWIERWQKWRRRRPHALGRLLTGVLGMAAVLIALGVVANDVWQRLARAEAALREGHMTLVRRDYATAAAAMERGLLVTDPWQVRAVGHFVPRIGQLRTALAAQLRRVEHAETAEELHCLVDGLRLRWGSEVWVPEPVRALEPRLRATWEARARLLAQIRGDLAPEAAQQLEVDLLELGIVWANLRVRLAPDHLSDLRRREALQVLDEAEAQFGSHAVLERERQSYAEALGLDDVARTAAERRRALAPATATAWEHYTLGRSLLDASDLEAAAREFAAASDLQPQDLWSRFSQGLCAYRLRRFAAAVAAFDVCVALAPTTAECYYNRARSHAALGHTEAALGDYNHALALAPELAVAALNRGVLLFRQRRYPEALADFQRALKGQASRAIVHYNLALAYLAQNDPVAARTNLDAALRLDPGEKTFRDLECRLGNNRRTGAGSGIDARLPLAVQSDR